jgi:hypothetical protein
MSLFLIDLYDGQRPDRVLRRSSNATSRHLPFKQPIFSRDPTFETRCSGKEQRWRHSPGTFAPVRSRCRVLRRLRSKRTSVVSRFHAPGRAPRRRCLLRRPRDRRHVGRLDSMQPNPLHRLRGKRPNGSLQDGNDSNCSNQEPWFRRSRCRANAFGVDSANRVPISSQHGADGYVSLSFIHQVVLVSEVISSMVGDILLREMKSTS